MKSLCVFILILAVVQCENRDIKDYKQTVHRLAGSTAAKKSFQENLNRFGGKNVGSDFPCSPIPPSSTVPTSAHKVRPSDIKIVAALGDSLTAGMGITANTVLSLLTEDRGLAFSIGGDGSFEEHITLPNILKKYNPSITGYAIKSGGVDDSNARFDVAESGNVFTDLNDEANLLIKRMQADINIDINNDWKLITILIGDNDLCKFCNEDGHEGERYVAELEKTLKNLQDNLPRTIVNLIEVLNIEIVKDLNKGVICSVLHYTVCTCAAFPKSEKDETELKKLTRTYQDYVHNLTTSGKFDTKDDFTVVDQPFFRETYLPFKSGSSDVDYSYFAPDCFHLSEKGHETAATALWNNMFQPVGKKDKNWGIGKPVSCPTEQQPYIFTNKNSDRLYKRNLSAFP